jgi:ubiquitin C
MDNNSRTPDDYNMKHQSMLDLQEKMLIYIKETLHDLTYSVNDDTLDTIDNIKNKTKATDGFPKGR